MTNWNICRHCKAKVGPAEGKYHECYEPVQSLREQQDAATFRRLSTAGNAGKRGQR